MNAPSAKRKYPGRPRVARKSGERATLSLRVTAELFSRLDEEAGRKGRPLSNEAEIRLEASFASQDLLQQVFVLTYGPELAAVLQIIGDFARNTITISKLIFDDRSQTEWIDDPYIFGQVAAGIGEMLASLKPAGRPGAPKARLGIWIGPNAAKGLGTDQARSILRGALTEGRDRRLRTALGAKAAERALAHLEEASHQDEP